ncbi:PPOX class F420-dependent oxidoreductase [Dietzia sp.]|uniref:PPOX class F420-dependent oxidoreductase n=1 Tax=Dietzia sp. TaxID=1871616 RepID=UPI002FD88823
MSDRPVVNAKQLDFLAKPNPAVMATLRKGGQPVTVATWYLLEGERIRFNLAASRVRLQHLKNDPRVALTVLADGDWYSHLSIQGTVVEIADDPDLSGIDKIARHYTGEHYAVRDQPRVDVWVSIDRAFGWGAEADD